MNREQKQELVSDLRGLFGRASTVVVAHYSGLTVSDLESLRGQMRDVGAGFRVIKNRITRIAIQDTRFSSLADLFVGPTGIAFSEDPVAAAKALVAFSKANPNLIVLGGAMGDSRLDVEGVKALASMPSLDELRGKVVGLLQAPATRVATIVTQPSAGLARVCSARASSELAA